MKSGVYQGRVMHHRIGTPEHRFRYGVSFFAIHLDELGTIARDVWPVGVERRALMGLRSRDHIGDPRAPLNDNYRALLRHHGLDDRGHGVLVTQLRQMGYVFNPISLVYWYREGALRAVIAEVANTFGERHPYVFPVEGHRGGRLQFRTTKQMHVSPFYGMDYEYVFVLEEPGERFVATISLERDGRRAFHSTWTGTRRPLTTGNVMRALARHPLMPLQVIGLIHAEAIRLAAKRARFHRKPRFRVGAGSVTDAAPPAGRSALRLPPPARRSPLTPAVRALSGLVLRRPGEGDLVVEHPDGRRDITPGSGQSAPVTITIHARDLYRRVARRGTTGVGEAYVMGDWDSDDLTGAMRALLTRSRDLRSHPLGRAGVALRHVRPRLPERMHLRRASEQIRYHYDLGNDLYRLFLDDETLTYSAAAFDDPAWSLAEAQIAKLRGIGQRLGLRPGQRVLEVGCGWGGFARLAAEEFGVHVTGVTLSHDQHAVATARAEASPARDRIDLRIQDYRTLSGQYDAIVSIEMIEAIGHAQLPTYFATLDRLLAPGGRAFVQAISIPDERYERYRRSRDWISEYIFPGGNCPSRAAMAQAMAPTRLRVAEARDIGTHYATTLRHWRERFETALPQVRALGFDDRFVRAWRFYLASCEAAFACGNIHDWQLVLHRPEEAS